jgi:hypothetical protein
MDALLFARSQMALSLAFHIIFAAVGIAMPELGGQLTPCARHTRERPRDRRLLRWPLALVRQLRLLSCSLQELGWSNRAVCNPAAAAGYQHSIT